VHHSVRIEGSKTPTCMQLWIGGLHFTHFGQTVMHICGAHPVPVAEINCSNADTCIHKTYAMSYTLKQMSQYHIHCEKS